MMTRHTPQGRIWSDFLSALTGALEATSDADLVEAWSSNASRTIFNGGLLQRVAVQLELVLVAEDFKVDYTLCVEVDSERVPVVFIESENDTRTARHEVRKLCCFAAPLGVLLTCTEWTDREKWRHAGRRDRYLEQWQKQIRAHGAVWPGPSTVGIVVAELSDKLRYYALALDCMGQVQSEEEVIFERGIS